MNIISKIAITIIALEHLYILYIEMFAWTTMGRKTFRSIAPDQFEKTKLLAANQGLYNGFLSAGLIWSIFIDNIEWSKMWACFF